MDVLSNQNKNRLSELAQQAAESLGLVLLRLTIRGTASRPVIEVILDGPRLVALGDCEMVSKKLNEAIDSEKLASGNYRLDVLSPGLDEPLVHDYQFQRSIGHSIEIYYTENEKQTSIKAILAGISQEEITLESKGKGKNSKGKDVETIIINRSNVEKAFSRAEL